MEDAFDVIADMSIVFLLRPTKKWKGQPKIWRGISSKEGVTIYTNSLPYYWTNFGTRPHPIDAKNAPFLVFRGPYTASTQPLKLSSRMAKVGKEWTRITHVDHPGTTPRNFTGLARKMVRPQAIKTMRNNIKRAIDVV